MVAYHYPPARISSGIQRTLKFSDYLRQDGWLPQVLTVHPRAYQRTGDDQMSEIPDDVFVKRAFALDTSRHLAVKGRYPTLLALPDRWVTWWLGATWSGLRMIRRFRPDLIWSTYPIATAHLVGLTLHRISGIPWVADFRDSMTEEGYPAQRSVRAAYKWIERRAVTCAERVTFTTPGTLRMYADRYPEIPDKTWAVIHNGYDEENFRAAEKLSEIGVASGQIRLTHSGVLYPSERDPTSFFDALASIKKTEPHIVENLRITLRASAHDDIFLPMVASRGIEDIVSFEPPIPYSQALVEMLQSDGLLVFQAANCNHQIPAKLYEYFRARKPILALTDPSGNTAEAMRDAGIDTIVSLDNAVAIKAALKDFLLRIRARNAPVATEAAVARYARSSQAALLARIFDSISS